MSAAIEAHAASLRCLRWRHKVVLAGNRAVQVSQGFGIVERPHLGHEAGEEIERAGRFGGENRERGLPVAALLRFRTFDQRAARRIGAVHRRQPGQRQMVAVTASSRDRFPFNYSFQKSCRDFGNFERQQFESKCWYQKQP